MNTPKGLLIDITKCIGCGECMRACAEANGLPQEEAKQLSAEHYTVLQAYHNDEVFVRRMCMHCVEPTCVSACLVGAFTKTSDGPVLYDADKCIGCRYCMQACPFQVPRYEWSSLIPRVQKCRMCAERVANGGVTACTEACPTGATMFGDREELIREGHRRIQASPEEYVDHIYGLTEAGGTSVMYLSGIPFEELGFPKNLSTEPIPQLSWKVLSQIPKYSVAATVLLMGIHWITARRVEVARFEAEEERLRIAEKIQEKRGNNTGKGGESR
ncbi:MAG TPA: 4Fe-4S dicluster domain-containing protein [Bacteroidota bacterium]